MDKVYFDTNIWIYHLQGISEWKTKARELIKETIDRDNTIVISSMFFTEFLTGRQGEYNLEKLLSRMDAVNNLELEIVHPLNAIYAGELRQKYKLRTPDAIHLATAIKSGCKTFWTGDKRLQKVKEIEVMIF